MPRANSPIKKSSNRVDKINSLIQRLLGEIIFEYLQNEPGITTIGKVQTTKDLKYAKVWVTILNGDDQKIMNKLRSNIFAIQGELNKKMEIKIIPRISFHLDTAARYADHISALLEKIKHEDEKE